MEGQQQLEVNKLFGNDSKLPNTLKNPFNKDCIISINMNYYNSKYWNSEQEVEGSIRFRNGDSEGTQNFKAKTFEGMQYKMVNFISSL